MSTHPNAFQLGHIEQAYTAFKALVQNASQGLVNRVIHQLDHYQDLIKKDHYLDVKNLIQNLQKLEFIQQADIILNMQNNRAF
ncbi:hypothetical protein A7P53_16495 [Acinetobacter defluvii]|nr:hypothetical protein [Acinetobacter defluvii]